MYTHIKVQTSIMFLKQPEHIRPCKTVSDHPTSPRDGPGGPSQILQVDAEDEIPHQATSTSGEEFTEPYRAGGSSMTAGFCLPYKHPLGSLTHPPWDY